MGDIKFKVIEILNEYNQNLEGYSYYGIVNGVSEDDYTEVSDKVANLDCIKTLEAKLQVAVEALEKIEKDEEVLDLEDCINISFEALLKIKAK